MAGALVILTRGHDPVAPPPVQAAGSTPLQIRHEGAALKVHWNPASADLRMARRGAIVIQDGGRESRLELSGRDLQAGVASYWPESRDVVFRLELDGAQSGAVRTTAQVQERKPSPFATTQPPRKPSVPIKRVQPAPAPMYVAEDPKRGPPVIRKIPLLRRLWKR
jgi:hypothetical protein